MPLYEYYCEPCNGIFEELRPMREATDPVPCPECYKDAGRIMPTSFSAFTFREGYARRIPDDGKYYHLGKKVNNAITGGVRPNEHPEINKPTPEPKPLRGDTTEVADMTEAAAKGDLKDLYDRRVAPQEVKKMVKERRVLKHGTGN